MGNNHSKELTLTVSLPSTADYWDRMFYNDVRRFTPEGKNGIDNMTGLVMDMDGVPFDIPVLVNTFLFEENNKILGILYHYPQTIISPKSGRLVDKKGSVTILVHPEHRRSGIGLALLTHCLKQKHLKINTADQLFTKEGAGLWKKALESC
jgi:GNAT superfamily N-acetyltransferase